MKPEKGVNKSSLQNSNSTLQKREHYKKNIATNFRLSLREKISTAAKGANYYNFSDCLKSINADLLR